jgi:hypothetical protein
MGGFCLPEEEEYFPPSESANCGVRAAFAETQGKPTETDKQNEQFTQIVETYREYYKKKSNGNLTYKKIFFFTILAASVLVIFGFAALCVALAARGTPLKDALPLLGGGTAALLTSFIVLPQIVATHLFPVGEDQILIDLIAALRSTTPEAGPK